MCDGLVLMLPSFIGHALHPATDYHAINAAQKIFHVATSARAYVARPAPAITVMPAVTNQMPESIFLK